MGMQYDEGHRRGAGRAALAGVALTLATAAGGALAADEKPISTVHYACADDKTIDATYYADKVALTLGDGRTMTLPQTMSGSGIRYANADESFVFWSKGNTAFATGGSEDKPTYADCEEQTD